MDNFAFAEAQINLHPFMSVESEVTAESPVGLRELDSAESTTEVDGELPRTSRIPSHNSPQEHLKKFWSAVPKTEKEQD